MLLLQQGQARPAELTQGGWLCVELSLGTEVFTAGARGEPGSVRRTTNSAESLVQGRRSQHLRKA